MNAKRSAAARLGRLEELKGLLKGGDYWTASAMAAELGTSLRTMFRDLELLRTLGVRIEAERGRGGGIRLQRGFGAERPLIDPREALDLLLALAIAERLGSPLLLRGLPALRRKIAAVLGDAPASRVRALRQRILVGQPASAAVVSTYAPPRAAGLAPLSQGFFEQRELALAYIDAAGKETRRVVEPQFLYYNLPVWYLLGWDRLRDDARTFRIDRIKSVAVLDASFRLRRADPFIAQAERDVSHL